MIIPALKLLSPKLIKEIIDYVTKENSLDIQMSAMIEQVRTNKDDIEDLKKKSHTPKNFVVCESCKKEIKNA